MSTTVWTQRCLMKASSLTTPLPSAFGNESVYITRRTDPPLRAGTYFISFTLWTTGKRVEATISAILERP